MLQVEKNAYKLKCFAIHRQIQEAKREDFSACFGCIALLLVPFLSSFHLLKQPVPWLLGPVNLDFTKWLNQSSRSLR